MGPGEKPSRLAVLALVYGLLVGPVLAGVGFVLEDWRIFVAAILPVFVTERVVDRGWVDSVRERVDPATDEVFAGVDDDELPEKDTWTSTLGFALDYEEVVNRLRYPTRIRLVGRTVHTVAQAAGWMILLLTYPDVTWPALVAALLLFVPSAPNVRIVAILLTPRFPAQVSDAERERWLKRDRRVEVALWTVIGVIAVGQLTGLP